MNRGEGDARGGQRKKHNWKAAAGIAAFTAVLWSTLVEPGAVVVREVELIHGSLPEALEGLRIAVGDIHAAPRS